MAGRVLREFGRYRGIAGWRCRGRAMMRAMLRNSIRLIAAVAALGACHAALAADPFGTIRIAANRSRYTGACPVEVIFTANINLNSPHPDGFVFNYHWERSDGAKGPVNVVRPAPGENRIIVKEPWTLGAAGEHYDLWVRLFVNSGNTHLDQRSEVVTVACK